MGLNAVALLWAFAEATLFFIVPDVWLSAIAIGRGRRAALRAMVWAIAGVHDELERQGAAAVAIGGVTGVPYKIYAVLAQAAGLNLPLFLLISVPARAIRFVLVVLIADGINRPLARRLTLPQRYGVLGLAWLAFYGFYFAVTPN